MSLATLKPMLEEFKHELQRLYGANFRRLILYGSYARRDAREGSDVDLLVVLREVEDPLRERERLSELISRLSLRYNVVLSVLPVAEEDLARPKPLFLNVRKEGISL